MRLALLAMVPLVGVVGIAGAAIVAAPALLKPRIEAAITQATGHAATIGDVSLTWGSGPELRIRGLALANPRWASRPDLARVPLAVARAEFRAMLGGVLRIDEIRLEQPDVLIETDASGHGNWTAEPRPEPAPSPAAPQSLPKLNVQLGRVAIADGHVGFRDGKTGRTFAATADGTVEIGAQPVQFVLALRNEAADLQVKGVVDRSAPVPLQSVSLTGHANAPEPIEVAASLAATPAGLTIAAQAHGAGAEAKLAGVLDTASFQPVGAVALDIAVAASTTLPRHAGLPAIVGPASLHAELRRQDETVLLRGIRLAMPAGDLAGQLDVALTAKPKLSGTLTSRRLDLPQLLAMAAREPVVPTPAPAAAPPATAAALPATPVPPALLPLEWLDRGDADIRLAVAELADGRVTLRDISGRLVIQDGRLALDPFAGTGPGGRVELSARADSRAVPHTVSIVLHAPGLALQPFVVLAGLPGDVNGTAAIEADLRATGITRPELLQSLGGRASVVMRDGDIDLHVFGDLLAAARLPIDPRGRAHLRCLVVRAEVSRGVATLSPLLVDATQLLVQGTGTVDLTQQTLALRLRPLLRTGPGIVVPLTLSGSWARPKIDLDRANVAGVIAGLVGQAGDACQAAGVASAAPPPALKPLKPADLLRSLLR